MWKDDILFWEDLVKKAPNQGLPHLNLGLAYSQNKRPADAEREFKKALESKYDDEGRSLAYNNLGNLYMLKKSSIEPRSPFHWRYQFREIMPPHTTVWHYQNGEGL